MPEHPNQRLCLHGTELVFTHPATGKLAKFHSPAPEHFYELVGAREAQVASLAQTPMEVKESPAAAESGGEAGGDSSWDHVSEWYDELLTDRVSDHHEKVVMPTTLRLLGTIKDTRVLDVACGQGILCRRMVDAGARVVGVDLATGLIEAARRVGGPIEYHVADARELMPLGLTGFDAATCTLALMNIEPLEPALKGIHAALKPGARFVSVILHPAFRNPGQTSWGWSTPAPQRPTKTRAPVTPQLVQYRRVDEYLSQATKPIVMNPGAVSSGAKEITTMTYHRPIHTYVNELGRCGFMVDAMEELTSSRVSQPGPRAAAENRSRAEIPMFLAIRAVRV
jgi:SAM-dependent methyltransferase